MKTKKEKEQTFNGKKVNKLFDYQRFGKNAHLDKLIKETDDRYGKELTDEDLGTVYAAGDVNASYITGKDSSAGIPKHN